MKVISYNLNKHKAIGELDALVESTDADILCLQEAETDSLPNEIAGLELVDATARNRLGLAVYLRRNTFAALEVRTLALKKSLHDRVLKPAEERMLAVRLRDIDHAREFIVASFHAAPLTALNSLRRKQIAAALDELSGLGENLPILMVGDYNYPVFKENLGQRVREAGYELTLSDSRTYTRYKFFRGHYDFATSVGFDVDTITTLPQGLSDHLPILVTAHPRALTHA
ncbi:MAG: exonuclease [Microbacterium sp. SCN 70-27]|uniref:endonuclease/exonuclease/phosphatase family protein n=1 Tax=unclassified Microbacterium TaxID=2609290 RepID=UPI00086E29FE|nr:MULTISPECIES: endonuclease/exonuclease/phosphatase family protein [unclassified Microbacterium]MBN9224456.1 endonuclease/exonuclease/phosphatase family protein [Microbacterium sp.]ODT28375.1 MAG: exonuclease [Microbacterium sp. SCN 70-27]